MLWACVPVATIALMMVAPDIAFEPDIRGVCNCDGIFEISSNPKKQASTNIKPSANVSMMHRIIKKFTILREILSPDVA